MDGNRVNRDLGDYFRLADHSEPSWASTLAKVLCRLADGQPPSSGINGKCSINWRGVTRTAAQLWDRRGRPSAREWRRPEVR
jgi:hypothetical protein